MSTTMLGAFYKEAGTNPEIDRPYYELSSYANIVGHSNFKPKTLGFKRGSGIDNMTFCPIDPSKPIVLAICNMSNHGFVYIDQHLEDNAKPGMRNWKFYKTDKFLIDCNRQGSLTTCENYWSITSEGITFVYGDVTFPDVDVWKVNDADLLCAFVAGELTTNQLRKEAYLSEREAVKKEKRETRIQDLEYRLDAGVRKMELDTCIRDLKYKLNNYKDILLGELRSKMCTGGFLSSINPFIRKASVTSIVESIKI